jgi:uncharacterized peroxidase-related enzyme
MSFLETVPPDAAEGRLAELYAGDAGAGGTVPNYARAFSLRPEVYAAWKQTIGAITAAMEPRRYELATVAAAARLRSSYCTLAHGRILAERHLVPASVAALVSHAAAAEVSEAEAAVMHLAAKVAEDATAVDEADIARLRALGLSDTDILDVILTAAARCFFSKVLDATGALPDAAFGEMEPSLRDALTVGRPIAGA